MTNHRFTILLTGMLLAASASRGQYVVDSIDVAGGWAGSMVYGSRWANVYGTSEAGIFFCIICAENTSFNWGLRTPRDVAYDSTDDRCYVIYSGGGDDSIRVARGSNGGRLRSFALPWADRCLWDPQVNRLYVTCGELNQVAVIDCATDSVIARIGVGAYPVPMVLNPVRRKLYVANLDGESVTVIDLVNLQAIRTIPLGQVPQAGAYSAVGDKCYFQSWTGVRVIACANDSVAADIPLPVGTGVLEMQPVDAHGRVMVATYTGGADFVYTIDALGDSLVCTTRVGREPCAFAYSALTDRAYCANADDFGTVSVLTGDGSQAVATVPVGSWPSAVLAVPDFRYVYVGHSGTRYVYVLRDTAVGIAEPQADVRASTGLRVSPSPFRDATVIESSASRAGPARVHAQDGRLMRELAAAVQDGRTLFCWDGRDGYSQEVPPGVYVVCVGSSRVKVVKLK